MTQRLKFDPKDEAPVDRRLVWLEQRVENALKLRPAEMKKLMDDDSRALLLEFLDQAERRNVFVVGTTSASAPYVVISGDYDYDHRYTLDFRRRIFFFMKTKKEKLVDEKAFADKIRYGDCSIDVLLSLHDLSKNIMLPLLENSANITNVPIVYHSDVKEKTHHIIANTLVTMGRSQFLTLLPLPPIQLPSRISISGGGGALYNTDTVANNNNNEFDRELVHEIERAVVDWSEAIRTAIDSSPDELEDFLERHPTPWDEIKFWEDKKTNLAQLEEQLSQPFILKCVVILRKSGSAYYSGFNTLYSELHESLLEASECVRYLSPLRSELTAIDVNDTANKVPIEKISESGALRKLFRLLLAVWADSKAFGTVPRMVNFISEMSNALILYCVDIMGDIDVFQSEPEDSIKVITQILNVCGDFKSAFFEAKAKAAKELPRPWRFQNAALFRHLDAMLERLHDVLDVIETTSLFNKSVNIRVGGAESVALSNQIDKIHERYLASYAKLQRVPFEDLYKTSESYVGRGGGSGPERVFEQAFKQYREEVSLLEHELTLICNKACADSESVPELFKVIDSFDGFHDRPIGRQDWANRQPALLAKWHDELMDVQRHFQRCLVSGECASLFPNVPPTSATIMWGQGLLQRLDVVHTRMMELDTTVIGSAKGQECQALHAQLTRQIQQMITSAFDSWASSVGQISTEKLRCFLLTHEPDANLFKVNFDPALAAALKEAILLESKSEEDETYTLPQQVLALNRSREVLRRHVLRLGHICTTVNTVNHTLRPCEHPLIEDEAAQMSLFLMKAVNELQWAQSEQVEIFVQESLQQVELLERAMVVLRSVTHLSQQLFTDFAAEDKFLPLMPSRSDVRVLTESEFRKKVAEHNAARRERLKGIGEAIHSKVEEAFASLNNIKGSAGVRALEKTDARWLSYLEDFSNSVAESLSQCTVKSLRGLSAQLSSEHIQKNNGIPLLDVKLTLSRPPSTAHGGGSASHHYPTAIVFDPPLLSFERQVQLAVQREKEAIAANSGGDGGGGKQQSYKGVGGGGGKFSEAELHARHQQRFIDIYPLHRAPQTSVEAALEVYINHIIDLNAEVSVLDPTFESETYRKRVEQHSDVNALLREVKRQIDDTVGRAEKQIELFAEHSYLFTENITESFQTFISQKAAEEAAKVNDGPAGAGPKAVPYYSGVPVEEYEAKIRQYEELHDVLGDLPQSRPCGFLKIDTKPLRTVLIDLCAKWRDSYVNEIANKTVKELEGLYAFVESADKHLNSEAGDGELEALKSIMNCIRDCRRMNTVAEAMLAPMSEGVNLLKRHPNSVRASTLDLIEELRKPALEKWNTLYRKSLNAREQYSSSQDREAQHVKSETAVFDSKIAATAMNLRNSVVYSYTLPADDSYTHIDKWAETFNALERESKSLLDLQELFELSPSEFKELRDCRVELVSLKHMWDVVSHVQTLFKDWMTSPFMRVDVDGFLDEIRVLNKQLKALPMKAREWDAFKGLQDTVSNMGKSLPLCAELRTPAMRDRHWELLLLTANATGHVDPTSDAFTLQSLVNLGIHNHSEEINNIVEKAQKELIIEKTLQKIEETWMKTTISYEKNKALGVTLLSSVDAIVEQLEADSNLLQSMMANRFVGFFLDRVQLWQKNLGAVDTCLVKWIEIQRKWINLFPIFVTSADIREQLPDDAARFQIANDQFRHLMQCAGSFNEIIQLLCTDLLLVEMGVLGNSPKASHGAGKSDEESHHADGASHKFSDLESFLQSIEGILLRCEKSLSDYLETKRKAFPRFFFVDDAALIDILSKGSDPKAVMVHMSKIIDSTETFLFADSPNSLAHAAGANASFAHVNGGSPASMTSQQLKSMSSPDSTLLHSLSGQHGFIAISGNPKAVHAMESREGEIVRLVIEYVCEGAVEKWMAGCITAMQSAIRMHISEATAGYTERPRTEWIYQYPCQAVICASRSFFTAETQSAFQTMEEGNESGMRDFLKAQRIQLDTLIREALTPKKSTERKMLVHLITIDVHNRDIIQGFVDDRIDSVDSFAWQSQLRYYWDETRGSEIRICDAEFVNGYEYVGLCGCLVITKLTDRCYTTLSQALRLKKGGAPAGPAGTGKTETTKDLARNLGIACYVFNCSDQMNYQSMAQIFKGLAMSGSWGCFDEFNRISIEVLSVVATQVGSILNALKAQRSQFRFGEEEITINHQVGMFITMNPGYAGRTELPENIKSLFRPCAMVVPDLRGISEIMLAAEGFGDAKDLALKFVTLYNLNKELLSPQAHYDWGLRAVKSVLYIAGGLKRSNPDIPERKVLMGALRDTNLAKLSKDDVYVFMGLIRSLFPNLEAPKRPVTELGAALLKTCKAMGNFPGDNDIFILKCTQYEEILHVRHSVFILGPAGCGKTQMWRCLQGALNSLGDKAVSSALNPKAITANELYGYVHPQTKEWKEGVLSNIFRQYALDSKTRKNSKWIVLDGIIDAEWIESMNTVMDDNKMLTLVSNERIPLTDSMRMIFEVSQLRNASPATVSRGGVIYINETDLGYVPFRDKWLATRDPREATSLESLLERYVPSVFEFYRRGGMRTITPVMDIAIMQTICSLLEGLLRDLTDKSVEVLEKYVAFAIIWAFGGPLPSTDGRIDYRANFSNWWRKENPHLKMSEIGTVFDYFIDAGDKFEFKPWTELVRPYLHDSEIPLSTVTVQTADTVRMNTLISILVDNGKPVMLVGTAGTGKTNIMSSKLSSLNASEMTFRGIAFNARTSSASLQAVMEQSLEKRTGRVYGPIGRKKLIFFLDDVNMPTPDKYGTQEAIALIQQHMNYGFWFDRTKMTQKEVHDVRYVAAMNPKSGAFTILDRVLRHFAVFATNMPDTADLNRIYGQILEAHLSPFNYAVSRFAPVVTAATIALQSQVTKAFLPTAVLFHYQWTMRELFSVVQGLCKSRPKLLREPGQLIRLWVHECERTYRDRMPSSSDTNKFDAILKVVMREHFGEVQPEAQEAVGLWAPLLITPEGDENVYGECTVSQIEGILRKKLDEYNSNVAVMDLVLFEQAIEHVCRIARIMSNPRGNALLVGVGGSGKQSLCKLASFILGLDVAQIQVTGTYNISNFRTDVQEIYKRCGLKTIGQCFLITDQQIVSQEMLVYLNDMLSSGNVPDLFDSDERDGIVQSIMGEVKQSGHPDYSNPDVCFSYFINKVRDYLHIVLCMSPLSTRFASWCRQFPAISNTTAIDWFHPWPADALLSVARRFLAEEDLGSEDAKEEIADFIAECHSTITFMAEEYFATEKRRCYTTPKSFLETIQLYKDLLRRNREKLGQKMRRLAAGIETIDSASSQVDGLKANLEVESVEVAEAKQKTDALLEVVNRKRGIVEEQRAIAAVEAQQINKLVQDVAAKKAECELDLAAARPQVEAAKAALDTLNKDNLGELRSMARPPDDVVMVCAAVKVLMSDPNRIPPVKNRDWANCKLMMGNTTSWLKDLRAFDEENIPQACVDAIQIYVTNPAFSPTNLERSSKAAPSLCKWVLGMNAYHEVRCKVRPKEARLEEADRSLTISQAQKKKIDDKVEALQRELDTLLAECNEADMKAKALEHKERTTRLKMILAERLVNGLSGEKSRWGKTIEALRNNSNLLVGDVLLASAFTSYIGPFSKDFRTRIVEEHWRPRMVRSGIAMTKGIDPVLGLLATEADVAGWCNDGLQSDPVSVQNGAIVMNCSRWPLLIDPQLQGVRWVRTQQEKHGLVVLQPGQKRWLDRLIDCIEQGLPCLIEGCDEQIDPVLDNVLSRTAFRRGHKRYLRVGSRDAEFNPMFKLFLQTRLSNPTFSPEINAQTTLINFTVTESGLEDQLLAVVVNHDRRDLEEKRATLIRSRNAMTIELQQCEDTLLLALSSSGENILEDVALVDNLESTKKKSLEISQAMIAATATQAKIAASRASYQPCAIRGSLIFFQIDRLCKIDHMYQYSLETFMSVFNKALAGAPQPEDPNDVEERVRNVSRSITEKVYAYVANGMFERHKLILSSMITFSILLRSGEIDRKHLEFLLQGKKKSIGEGRPESVRDWCPEASWMAVLALAEVEGTTPSFAHLPQDMADSNRWKLWCESERPEEEKLPADWKGLTPFQKLLILRSLRPDRLTNALENFVAASLGKFFISDQAVDLSVSLTGSSPINPIFFILSPGVDPVREVEALGVRMGFTADNNKFHNISLGQGQELVAERALHACFTNGGWCMLNNVHLVQKWMRSFEKLMEGYAEVYGKMAAIQREKEARRAARRHAWQEAQHQTGGQSNMKSSEEGKLSLDAERDEMPEELEEGAGAAQMNAAALDTGEDGDGFVDDEDEDLDDPSLVQGSLEFRIFLSAEPSESIPISVLQRSVKLSSEPPTGIKQNVMRALRCFADEPWEKSAKPAEFRAVTLAMCFFHAVVVERKKFGPQGWNRAYPFNIGDLTTCVDVLGNYIEDRPKVPWEDLRYVFGEIMYGGHITDDRDRILCMAYLNQWIVPEIIDGLELAVGFPMPGALSFSEIETYIEEMCPPESPILYGLHPNAEINYRTVQAQTLLSAIADLQPKNAAAIAAAGGPGKRKSIASGEVETPNDLARAIVDDLTEKLPENFNLVDISERLDEDRSPTQHVFYQECERLNILLDSVRRSLAQLTLALKGELSMSEELQTVSDELILGRVPQWWMRDSFASVRPLALWFESLLQRYTQCNDWTAELTNPKVIFLNLFFNPMSLLTALMQQTSIANNYDLDQMGLLADVTKRSPDQIDVPARDGAYVYGLVMEGARWDTLGNCIEESRNKELYPKLPVVLIRALPLSKLDRRDQYECPVYKTQTRGPTYVTGLFLKTKVSVRKWVIAGVGLLLDIAE